MRGRERLVGDMVHGHGQIAAKAAVGAIATESSDASTSIDDRLAVNDTESCQSNIVLFVDIVVQSADIRGGGRAMLRTRRCVDPGRETVDCSCPKTQRTP